MKALPGRAMTGSAPYAQAGMKLSPRRTFASLQSVCSESMTCELRMLSSWPPLSTLIVPPVPDLIEIEPPSLTSMVTVPVGLLLAGFHVGIGDGVDGKEETTIAANDLSLLARPLDRQWRKAIERSHSAEPMSSPVYRQAPMSLETWDALQAHPQFR